MVGGLTEFSLSSFSSASSSSSLHAQPPIATPMLADSSSSSSSSPDTHSSSINATTTTDSILIYSLQDNVVICVAGMLLLFLILLILACKFKPWRLFLSLSSAASRSRTIKVDDLERPLISEDLNVVPGPDDRFSRDYAPEGADQQLLPGFSSPLSQGPANKQSLPKTSSHLAHSDSFVLNIRDRLEDTIAGQTLLHSPVTNQSVEVQKNDRKENVKYSSRFDAENNSLKEFFQKKTARQGSILNLEVISGPSCGFHYTIKSTNTSGIPLTLGRVSPSNMLIKDSEVSGKHVMIDWNTEKLKWELVDMGSLNGTLLNSQPVHHPHSGSRHRGDPVEVSSGDIITLGTTSKILVQITSQTECEVTFGVGIASDAMALRRGAKKLPMEDVCYYQWPLPGTEQFGLFGICDGHGGASAATSVSKIMPETVASLLSDSCRRENVLVHRDASDVLKEAFSQTEACINHHYEGCTATVLLVWADGSENFFVQCANVGDSACFINIDGKQVKMTEDHRISSYSERLRMQATGGEPLRDGETRLCGINLGRMLGDKFLKQQDARFSSEPFISQVVNIHQASKGFALLASDGFWDVVNMKKAFQLVNQARERSLNSSPEAVANFLLSEARSQRTKDNTSIMFLDFDTANRIGSCKPWSF